MDKTKLINILSMAQRSGKLSSGDFMVERTIKRRRIPLLLLASDVADNNRKKYLQLCENFNIPVREVLTKTELGQGIGKEKRVVVAVQDKGFATAMINIIDKSKENVDVQKKNI